MARPQSPPILAQLRNARTASEKAAALRALKNDIVGHVQKKEQWVSHGVLDQIARAVSPEKSPARLNGKGSSHLQLYSRPLSDDDEARLQALQLIASFAHGGPAFLAPIHASHALSDILANVSPCSRPPEIVVAALRALTDIASSAALADDDCPLTTHALADQVFSPAHVESLNAILSISSAKHLPQTQVVLACRLVQKLCRHEKHQSILTAAGVLDSLAARLASFAVADGYVVPGAEEAACNDGLLEAFPPPAPDSARLQPVLEAISAILGNSKYRANRLLYAPAIMAVFPPIRFQSPMTAQSAAGTPRYDQRNTDLTAMEYVLPALPIQAIKSATGSPFALATPDRSDSQLSSRSKAVSRVLTEMDPSRVRSPAEVELDDVESPLLPWLVHLVRCTRDSERLMAASILASLHKAGLGSKRIRETSIGLLVVPLLVDMIEKYDRDVPTASSKEKATQRAMLEEAPLILARLIVDCEFLQKAAVDCHAVKILTKLLRRAYSPVEPYVRPMWTPHPEAADVGIDSHPPIAQLGGRGQNEVLAHNIRLRESALKAIAALAAGREDYRKALVAEDFVPYVVESLSEFPRKPHAPAKDRAAKDGNGSSKNASSPDGAATDGDAPATTSVAPEYGRNTPPVVIAACHTVRVLSRSISILRTALVDYGVALPLFHFLQHRDMDLLKEKGVMSVLCEHTHSDNPSLRLNALWALKHLVVAVGPELKKACLEEIGSGWLVQLIQDDAATQDDGGSRLRDMDDDDGVDVGGGESRGEQQQQQQQQQHRWIYEVDGEVLELDASRSTRMRRAEARLTALREAEGNAARRARNDDMAIQEQGLDFIRNLIGRPGAGGGVGADTSSDTSDMVDHLFRELGQDRLFDMVASKLRPRYLHPFSRRTPVAGREARVVNPQPQVIVPAVYILVQMAASDARHRQLVTAQTELLRQLVQYSGRDKEVKIALCHLVINLTCQDDEGDGGESEGVGGGCRLRAAELRRLGFYDKMIMFQEDRELDVKERAKEAVLNLKGSAREY
ncbi:armadillo repeat protein [Geosmithia morbida]|uniref:Armadillo repeat protein n=1 Tax=Geosmithia morbida TaxID=1094350 RepID=A0A9P5D1B5_9HYPO|nr:armadillo repeat protein [Geosmithia morbida]KAF4123708.1 armadillo repeat protein [Geosmithia morbida]